MPTFTFHRNQFWLNNQPLLLQAGEFHYFRTPADQWEHRLGLLKQAGFNAVAAYIPWLWHQPQPNLTDFNGHTHPMRNLLGFLNLAADMGLYIIARPGPYIMAETINEGIPPWVFEQNPLLAFISQDGQAQNIASYLHPDFLKCVEGWYQSVFNVLSPHQVTKGKNILLVQLDNEMGMIPWVRNIVDINPDTLERFATYLHENYPHNFSSAPSIHALRNALSHPQTEQSGFLLIVYRRFYRAYLRQYAATLWQIAKTHGLEVPPVINIHGFGNGGKTFPIGLSQLIEVMQIPDILSATDVYPLFIGEGNFHQLLLVNEMTLALQNPHQPLFSIEFQAGGNQDFSGTQSSFYDLHTRLSLSVGMRAINHYLFFDGENDPTLSPVKRHDWGHPVRKDGSTRHHFARYARLSKTLASYGSDLTLSRPKTITTIGFLLDYFMTEVNNPFTEEATKVITHQRDTILFDFIARGLAITQRPFHALELSRAIPDPTQTPSLWVMMERQCNADVQQKLVDYVHAGGQLILVGRICLEDFQSRPCTLLKDALGITRITGGKPFASEPICAFRYQDTPASFVERYAGQFDEVFASANDGGAIGFIKTLGNGKVMVFGASLAANTLDDLDILNQMARRINIQPLFEMSHWADARLSEGEDGNFLFINNYQDDPIETRISHSGRPLFGGHPIRLAARRGAILPLEWQITPGVLIHYSNAEILAVEKQDSQIVLRTDPCECILEVSLDGYRCEITDITRRLQNGRLELHKKNGQEQLLIYRQTR